MRLSVMFSALAVLTVAACEAPQPDDAASPEEAASAPAANSGSDPVRVSQDRGGEAQMQPEDADADDGQCGADRVGEYLGSEPTDEVRAAIAGEVGDRPIRYYAQGDPITMDFNPERLNVELGEDGRIKLFRCG